MNTCLPSVRFLETVNSDKNELTANMCSYFFQFEIQMQEQIRKLLNEDDLEDLKAKELMGLMEEASITMTPILKILSQGVFNRKL